MREFFVFFLILGFIVFIDGIITIMAIEKHKRYKVHPPLTPDEQRFIDEYEKERYIMGVDPYEVEDDERLTKEEKEFIRQWDKEMNNPNF